MTQQHIIAELAQVNNSELLLEDTWLEGLKKVRTPYVCLVESDCLLSLDYIVSSINILKSLANSGKNYNGIKGGSHGGGGYTRLAMLASSVGILNFSNRVYSFGLEGTKIEANRDRQGSFMYPIQIGFVPGAIIRMSAIKDDLDKLPWDDSDSVKMSIVVSFYLWGSNRRVELNPSTTYITNDSRLNNLKTFKGDIPEEAINTFKQESIR